MPGNLPDDELDRMVRAKLAPARAARGACPSDETLGRYVMGALDAAEALAVKEHLARCGVCDALLLRMRAFEERPERSWSWLATAAGWAVAALLVYPAYRGLLPAPPPLGSSSPEVAKAIDAPVEAPPGLSLDIPRTRSADARAVLAQEGERFFLQFFLPARKGHRYRAVLTGLDGKPFTHALPLQSWDQQGNFLLLCRSAAFPPGAYRVEIEETAVDGAVTNRWSLPFER